MTKLLHHFTFFSEHYYRFRRPENDHYCVYGAGPCNEDLPLLRLTDREAQVKIYGAIAIYCIADTLPPNHRNVENFCNSTINAEPFCEDAFRQIDNLEPAPSVACNIVQLLIERNAFYGSEARLGQADWLNVVAVSSPAAYTRLGSAGQRKRMRIGHGRKVTLGSGPMHIAFGGHYACQSPQTHIMHARLCEIAPPFN